MLRTILCVFLFFNFYNTWAEDNSQYLESLDISNGQNHVCATTTMGVKCFGNVEAAVTKVPKLKNPRNVVTGKRYSCAIVDDGIRCWGEIPNYPKQEMFISNGVFPNPKLLSAGYDHFCAVSAEEKIKCWGNNENNESTPPQNLKSITELSLGMNNSCALAENQVICWGNALTGSTEVPLNLVNPRNLTSGMWHHCVQSDEGIKCWGNPYKEFVTPDDSTIKNFTSGGMHNCAVVAEGVKCWDEKGKTTLMESSAGATKVSVGATVACALIPDGVRCWRLSDKGNYKLLLSYVPAGGITNIENISTGNSSTCAYGDGGKLKCWGANFDGALNVPTEIPGPLSHFSVGLHKTCAVKESVLSCWGDTNPEYNIPSSLGNVSFLSSGGFHVCAGSPERIQCWGQDLRGAAQVPKELTNFSQVSSGMLHSCAVASGQVECWGGEGLIKDVNPPTKMINPKALCAGGTFSCGIAENGKVQCWGEQLPFTYRGIKRDQANEVLNVPDEIVNATEISCGANHGCAIYNGKIKCWGSGAFSPERLIAPPTIKNPRMLSAGWFHTCAVGDKGLSCWGTMNGKDMPDYSLVK